MRTIVRLSMAAVALAAAMLSYQSLMHLGQLAGYGSLAPLYAVVVDAGAAASCAAWLHTRAQQPLVMTWALLAVSVVLNGTVHWLESTRSAPSWWLVVAVAAVPPTVLGLCVHLAVGLGGEGSPNAVAPSTEPGCAEPITPAVQVETPDPLAQLVAQGAGRRRVAAELGVTEYEARKLLASRNGSGHVPSEA